LWLQVGVAVTAAATLAGVRSCWCPYVWWVPRRERPPFQDDAPGPASRCT
jgi:hypothetical protein